MTNSPLTFRLTVTSAGGVQRTDEVKVTPVAGDSVTVTRAVWKVGDFRIDGTGTVNGAVITVHYPRPRGPSHARAPLFDTRLSSPKRGSSRNCFSTIAADDWEARDLGQARLDPADPVARVRRAVEQSGAKDLALDTGPAEPRDLDLRERPDDEARRERQIPAAVIYHAPPDPTDELDCPRER